MENETYTIKSISEQYNISRPTIDKYLSELNQKDLNKAVITKGRNKRITQFGHDFILAKYEYRDQIELSEHRKVIDENGRLTAEIDRLTNELNESRRISEEQSLNHSKTTDNMINNHHQQISQLNQIVQNQQVLTLQIESKDGKKGFFSKLFNKDKGQTDNDI